jgi:hypothetical protein
VTRRVRWVLLFVAMGAALPACSSSSVDVAPCGRPGNQWILLAQSVPSATFLPCLDELPAGWLVTGARFERGSYTAWLDSDRAGIHAVQIRLTRTCDVARAVEVPAVHAPSGVRIYERPISLSPRFIADRYVTFDGGCVTYTFRFGPSVPASLALEVQQSFDLVSRGTIRGVLERYGLELCGAGAPPCPG